ncbi:MAG: hypothetical protein AAGD25_20325 [Cyanobacteria bacterium P01_F01_bin.150]
MTLDQTTSGTSTSNLTSVASQPANLANLAYTNAILNTNLVQLNAAANQQAMNQLGLAITANVANLIAAPSSFDPIQVNDNKATIKSKAIEDDIKRVVQRLIVLRGDLEALATKIDDGQANQGES